MKALYIFLFSFWSSLFADYNFTIQPRSYLFSTHFDIYSSESYITTVETHSLNLLTTYSLYDKKQVLAKGIAKFFSLGSLFDYMKEINVFDSAENQIGFIQGDFWTTASAKFSIFDNNQKHCATAFLDQTQSSVSNC